MTPTMRRLRAIKERLSRRRAERQAAGPERAQRRAQAEALRRENRARGHEDPFKHGGGG